MSALRDDLKQLGLRLSCVEVEARKDREVVTVFIGDTGLSEALQSGLDSIFEVIASHDLDSVLLKDKVWLEVRKVPFMDLCFEVEQGWPGSGTVTRRVTWKPSHRVSKTTHRLKMDFRHLSPDFCAQFNVVAPYVAGAMAGGIASAELVQSLSKVGILSFFGSGGLSVDAVEVALSKLAKENGVWGCNLLHNPSDPSIEERTVDLFMQYGVSCISASAYMRLSKALVRYRILGLSQRFGKVHSEHKIFAKVSHPSVVNQFLSPPPVKLVQEFLRDGIITSAQAELARYVPMADAITVEGDSGGHTDSRPLSVILPSVLQLRNQAMKEYGYNSLIWVGAAGGIATPMAIQGALAMGAEYVLLGSVHQATVEAGTSDLVKEMLSKMDVTDCALGIAPDMFEIGAHVQVLKKGTMYAQRSQKLYALYQRFDSIESLPKNERDRLEKQIFQAPLNTIWQETERYWQRDASQLERAQRDSKYKMALIFRWYLGNSSRWAREGAADRKKDFQIWCGPSLGGFNQWVAGTPLENWKERKVVTVVRILLEGVQPSVP